MSKPDDLADVRVLHNAERAESEWLLARENDPTAPTPSSAIAAEYAELEDLLGSLSSGPSDERWQDDVLRAASAAALLPRPWWRTPVFRWVMGGALAVTATVGVLMLLPHAPELEVTVRHIGIMRGAPDEAVVGDHLVVTARPREVGDLRVYRSDGTLVARCPNGAGCRTGSHGEQTLEITLDAPMQYYVILVDGPSDALLDGAIDGYLRAADAAGAHITRHRPIDVH